MRVPTIFFAVALAALAAFTARGVPGATMTGQERAEDAGRTLIGSPAPALVLHTIDGQEIDLHKLYGKKAVYLKFWATWCIPCRQQMPHLERTYETSGPDLAVIAIDVGFNDSIEDVKAVRQSDGLSMPIVIDDGRLDRAFHLRVTPQHVIIDRNGIIRYVGHLADQRLDDALVAARATEGSAPKSLRTSSPKDTPQYALQDRLPDMSATTIEGQVFRLRDHEAQHPAVLVFLSGSCESYLKSSRPERSASCREVREQIASLAEGHSSVRWLGIAAGLWTTRDDLLSYQDKYKPKIPLTLDESGDLFRSFRVISVPTVLIADNHGRIVYRHEGYDSGLPAQLKSVLE